MSKPTDTEEADNDLLRTENENLRAHIADLVTTLERIKATTGDESYTWEGVARWMARQATYALARFAGSEPAKHPDTERLEWVLNYCDIARHDKLLNDRDAIDSARKQGGAT